MLGSPQPGDAPVRSSPATQPRPAQRAAPLPQPRPPDARRLPGARSFRAALRSRSPAAVFSQQGLTIRVPSQEGPWAARRLLRTHSATTIGAPTIVGEPARALLQQVVEGGVQVGKELIEAGCIDRSQTRPKFREAQNLRQEPVEWVVGS